MISVFFDTVGVVYSYNPGSDCYSQSTQSLWRSPLSLTLNSKVQWGLCCFYVVMIKERALATHHTLHTIHPKNTRSQLDNPPWLNKTPDYKVHTGVSYVLVSEGAVWNSAPQEVISVEWIPQHCQRRHVFLCFSQ